jgi:LacI family transcriptional regulator
MTLRMKDIANELGLSIVTISKVLRKHPDISAETRERVLKHVNARNYQPNILAQSLVTGRSFLIGLVVPDLLHPFFAEVAKSLSLAIRPEGYALLISSSDEDPALEEQEIRLLLARRIDAIVVASTATTDESFDALRKGKHKFLLIDRNFSNPSDTFVGVDDFEAGRLATEHLIKVGCKRIGHITGTATSTGSSRLRGYREALARHGLTYRSNFVVHCDKVDTSSDEQGAEAAQKLVGLKTRPDGIFCYNDPLAIGAMRAILAAGLRIPEDIALVGCGNLHYDDSLLVPLSSIDQQTSSIGKAAGKIVLELIESKASRPPKSMVLKPTLVVRASSNRKST